MAEPFRVKDLFSLPEHIRKGDFVIKLAEGIDDPKATAATYKVTPALADAFDRALRLGLGAARSQAEAIDDRVDRSCASARAPRGPGRW